MYSLENINDFKIENIYCAGVFQNEIPKGLIGGFSDRVEAVFVNSGKLTITCNSKSYLCNSGTAAFFKSGEPHFIKPSSKEFTEYLAVSFSVLPDITFEFSNKITSLTVLQKLLVQSLCNLITSDNECNIALPSVFAENQVNALKLETTIKLLTVDMALNKDDLPPQNTRDAILFETAVKEMESKVLGQLSLDDLANKLDISLSHLKRIFAGFCDVGVHEYFMGLKIREAIKMLKNGSSVTETAELTGFNNQNYFSAAFKRIMGTSPKEYCSVKRKPVVTKTSHISKKETVSVERKKASDMPSYLL